MQIEHDTVDSNTLANITRRLIGAIYCRIPDVMNNVACDWLAPWFYVADELTLVQNSVLLTNKQ